AEAYTIASGFKGVDRVAFAAVCNDFGALYVFDVEDYAKARALYDTALAVHRERKDSTAYGFYEVLNNLGFLQFLVADYKNAELLLKEAVALEVSTAGTNTPVFAITTSHLAEVHAMVGDFTVAAEEYRSALDTAKRVLGENHSRYGLILGSY